MPKYITVPYEFQEVKSSKHITIQVEIKTNTTCSAIKKVLCLDKQQQQQQIQTLQAPHQASFLAYIIHQFRDSLVQFKSKKDNPIQLEFGVYDGKFILSVQFLTDNASLRQVLKLIVNKVFAKRFESAYKSLKKFDKTFTDSNEKEDIQKSMQSMLSQTTIFVLSKHVNQQILPMMEKVIEDISKKQIEEIQDPIKYAPAQYEDQYVRFQLQRHQVGELIYSVFLASLNLQGIDYVLEKDKLFIRKGDIDNNIIRNCSTFIRERLKFTDKSKVKHYADQTAEYKKKMTADQHKAKQDLQKTKKIFNMIQVLYSTGSVGMSQKKMIYDEVIKIDLERVNNMIRSIEDCLKIVIKTK